MMLMMAKIIIPFLLVPAASQQGYVRIPTPTKDGQAILEDYYRRAFGPAAADVRAYFETVETARMKFVDENGYGGGVFNFPQFCTKELLREAGDHLKTAAEQAGDAPDIYRERVEFIQAGLTFTELLIANIVAMDSFWRKKDDSIDDFRQRMHAMEHRVLPATLAALARGDLHVASGVVHRAEDFDPCLLG